MKIIILLSLIVFCAVPAVEAQARKRVGRKTAKAVNWKDVKLEKWGIQGLKIPETLADDSETVTPNKNVDVTWTNYEKSWAKTATNSPQSKFELTLTVTDWDADFAKVTTLKPEVATPENLVAIDLTGDLRNKSSQDGRVEEADFYTVDGIKGTLTRAKVADNRIWLIWQTYRYFNNKAQRISVLASCPRTELQTASKIIDSLKIQK